MTRDWHQWLIDRGNHRNPVDNFFRRIVSDIKAENHGKPRVVLELGPGPEMELTKDLEAAGIEVWTADIQATRVSSRDILLGDGAWVQGAPFDEARNPRRLPFQDAAFNYVLAREVLEHVDDLPKMLLEIRRILRPGAGLLYFSTPFIFPLHDVEMSGDYWRLSPQGWGWILRETCFLEWDVHPTRELFGSWQLPVSILGWARI